LHIWTFRFAHGFNYAVGSSRAVGGALKHSIQRSI